MSYTSGHQREVLIAAAASTASLAVVGRLTPGIFKVKLKAVALVFTTAAAAAGVLDISLRPTPGSASSEVVVDSIAFDATSGAVGRVVFIDGLDIDCPPGQEIAFTISDVAASGVCDIKAIIEDNWENPANNTEMTETA